MKPVKLKDFYITSSIARNIARQRGEVNSTYDTNRKKTYYFSCSGHGGFIFDRKALTNVEQDTLDGLGIKPHTITIYLGEDENNETYVRHISYHISYPTRRRGTGKLYSSYRNLRAIEWEYYVGEEDCGRALFSYFCDIQYGYTNTSGNKERTDKQMSEQTVKRRYRKEWEQYNGQIIPPGVSPTKDDDVWEAEHLEDYVVRSGGLSACHIDMKDEELSIPEGYTLCIARLGKNRRERTDSDRMYFISKEVYKSKYVIGSNPDKEILFIKPQ